MTQNNDAQHRTEAVAWLLRLKPGTATADDVAAFKTWCSENPAHAKAFVEARELWDAMGPAGQNVFDPYALENLTNAKPQLGRRAFLGGAMAASVSAVAVYAAIRPPLDLWPSLSELNSDYRTATGEQRQIALANDIAIAMNTQTSIDLGLPDNDMQRIKLIAGEGIVSAKSHSLEVSAAGGNVRATNATFNVRRDGDKVCITCLAGEVSVECRSSSVNLASQHQVSYSEAGMGPIAETDPAVVTSWREGFLVFQDTRLADVIAEINRYRRGRIVVVSSDLGSRPVNGRFYLARLDEVVEKFRNAFGAHVTNLPGRVVVLS